MPGLYLKYVEFCFLFGNNIDLIFEMTPITMNDLVIILSKIFQGQCLPFLTKIIVLGHQVNYETLRKPMSTIVNNYECLLTHFSYFCSLTIFIMKRNLLILFVLIVAAALYRIWDTRPMGFAPQIAMALFAGAVSKDKRLAFLFPIVSLFISDLLYQVLYLQGLSTIKGFYSGQIANYILIASITIIGIFINKNKISHIFLGSIAGAVYFFLVSNFMVWIGGGLDINNLPYERSINGLLLCYTEALPFFKWSLLSTLLFNGVFFGSYYFLGKSLFRKEIQSA